MGFWNNFWKRKVSTPTAPSPFDIELEEFQKRFPDTPRRVDGESADHYLRRLKKDIKVSDKKIALQRVCLNWFDLTPYDMEENHQRTEREFDALKEKYFHQVKKYLPASLSSTDERDIYELIGSISYTNTEDYLVKNFHKFFKLATGEESPK